LPTVNIGDRQRGRAKAESILNCEPKSEEILKALKKALSKEHADITRGVKNPYEGKEPSEEILSVIKRWLSRGSIDLKKKFHDLQIYLTPSRLETEEYQVQKIIRF
jgi:GDP/UDP-N,N'-diacetylbacillosamine 2-epimerase (hydrolysing)